MKDMFGKELKIGDTILMASLCLGRGMTLETITKIGKRIKTDHGSLVRDGDCASYRLVPEHIDKWKEKLDVR